MFRNVLTTTNQQIFEVRFVNVKQILRDSTGSSSVTTWQVSEPEPRLKANVKKMSRGSGTQPSVSRDDPEEECGDVPDKES